MTLTDVDYKGDVELHIKYGGIWLMKVGKHNVEAKEIIQVIEELSIALQRAVDKISRGEDKNDNSIVGVKGEEEFLG